MLGFRASHLLRSNLFYKMLEGRVTFILYKKNDAKLNITFFKYHINIEYFQTKTSISKSKASKKLCVGALSGSETKELLVFTK